MAKKNAETCSVNKKYNEVLCRMIGAYMLSVIQDKTMSPSHKRDTCMIIDLVAVNKLILSSELLRGVRWIKTDVSGLLLVQSSMDKLSKMWPVRSPETSI
jgi:hypothetical protein